MEIQQQDELAELLINSLKRKEVKKSSKALQMGADPNYIGPEGFAAIHLAAGLDGSKGEQLLNLVLQYGGNANLKSLDSETALHVAVMWNRENSTRTLLAHGADPTIKNADGYTAFQLAANSSDHEFKCLEMLKSSCVDDSSENEISLPKFKGLNNSEHKKISSPRYKEMSSLAASVSESEQFDSLDELFTWDTDADSSTSYFSLPKHSLKGLITELKEGEEHHIVHKVMNGEASLILGSDFEPRISLGEIPISLIRNTNETILLEQMKKRSQKNSLTYEDGLLHRKKRLSQKQEQKLKGSPKSVGSNDNVEEKYSGSKPRLFESPFPFIQMPDQNFQRQTQNERRNAKASTPATPTKLFEAPVIKGRPFLIIPSSINSFNNAESNVIQPKAGEPVENHVNQKRELEKFYFNFPYSSNRTSSNDVTNRTASNEENGSNSKPGSGNEETESEFPIMQRLHSPRNLYPDVGQNNASRTPKFVDQSTTMHTDVRDYVGNLLHYDSQDRAVPSYDIGISNQSKLVPGIEEFEQGSDVFITDNESPPTVESDGNSSGYSGDVSQFSSPDDVVTDVIKFDLRNSPSVTIRNKSKKKDSSTDASDDNVNAKSMAPPEKYGDIAQEQEQDLPMSSRKRLNAATSSDEEEKKEESKGKKLNAHMSPRRIRSPSQRIRENIDHTFGDRSALKSSSIDDLKSFHRTKLTKQHHIGSWKGNCECELCMTKKASLPSSPALPNCEHEQCLDDEENTFKEVTIDYDWKDVSLLESTDTEHALIVPDELQALSLEDLKQRLIQAGEKPGPITASTKNIYLKQLARIEAGLLQREDDSAFVDYLPELRDELKELSSNDFGYLEDEMSAEFENPQKHKWREGTQKTSFNYLLLDPRVTVNLVERAKDLSETEVFRCFVRSVFYVGKGKESRPYGHLHEAIKMKKLNDQGAKVSDKLKMILNIWQSGFGVVSLHLFHSIIPVEAYTREACMIEALGLTRLTNLKKGEFYGAASSWNSKKKRQLGIHLLKKALKIFLVEGEKHIREKDL